MSVLLLSLLLLRLWKRNRECMTSKVEKPPSLIRGVKMCPKSLLRDTLSLSRFIRTNATSYNCLGLLPSLTTKAKEPARRGLACFTPSTATVWLWPVTQEVLLEKRDYGVLPWMHKYSTCRLKRQETCSLYQMTENQQKNDTGKRKLKNHVVLPLCMVSAISQI